MKKQIDFEGKKIFYSVSGNGKPVMLVHGFGDTGKVWKNQVEFLNEHFKIIVPDLPGSGQSEMIEDLSMEGMAEKPPQTPPKEGLRNAQRQLIERV